jgi:hypothetical protein
MQVEPRAQRIIDGIIQLKREIIDETILILEDGNRAREVLMEKLSRVNTLEMRLTLLQENWRQIERNLMVKEMEIVMPFPAKPLAKPLAKAKPAPKPISIPNPKSVNQESKIRSVLIPVQDFGSQP